MEVPLLVTDFLDRAVRIYPDKVAIVDGERRFTYREFAERTNRLANALLDRLCDGRGARRPEDARGFDLFSGLG